VIVLQFEARFGHDFVQPGKGRLGVGYPGKDWIPGIVLVFRKLKPAQEQAETAAVIPFLHGLHGLQHRKGGEGLARGFHG